ncbi:phospholipase-related [Anaeramoeba ignava]|uniref:Phospholipase-related n=1 Tax=Anaeramoeba ignava TaxID=1746090 RepID=A0A9Q0RG24_ANAIG|nr:phospholipase-related [Anaeramoeba ignava]
MDNEKEKPKLPFLQAIESQEITLKKAKTIESLSILEGLNYLNESIKRDKFHLGLSQMKLNESKIKISELLQIMGETIKENGRDEYIDISQKLEPYEKRPKVVESFREVVKDVKELWIQKYDWKEDIRVIEDNLVGANIMVVIPREWNHKALLMAHGFRPENLVEQRCDIDTEELFTKRLLKNGWIVAMTSYRRNGRVVREGIEDINNLRGFVVENFGEIEVCILQGRSMGGCVVTHIAEMHPDLYDGCVAIGAALYTKDGENPLDWEYEPKIPIIYLTNQSELGVIQDYIKKSGEKKKKNVIIPAIWEVWREGHDLVSQQERYIAFKYLMDWIQFKSCATYRKTNLFINHQKKKVESPVFDQNGAQGVVVDMDLVYGSFSLNFSAEDMKKLNIGLGKWFDFSVDGSNTKFHAYYGSYPFFVEKGSWITYDDPDGLLCFEILNYYQVISAIETAGVSIGTKVFIYKNF